MGTVARMVMLLMLLLLRTRVQRRMAVVVVVVVELLLLLLLQIIVMLRPLAWRLRPRVSLRYKTPTGLNCDGILAQVNL